MSGILDLFDSPDALAYILGGSPGGGTAGPGTVDPSQAMTPQTFGGPPTPQQNYRLAQAGWPTNAPDPTAFNPPAPAGGGLMTANAAEAPPMQRRTVPDILAPVGPPIAPPGAPLDINPPNPGAALPPNSAPAAYGGLEGALGLRPNPPMPTVSPWQNFLGGVGAGMSRVGAMRPGASAAANIATGIGGGIQGGLRQNDIQQAQVRQAHNDLFNQSSMAFRDMLANDAARGTEEYRQAQANWLNTRASTMRLNGGSNAYQNTPYWKTMKIEDAALKYQNTQKQLLMKQWSMQNTTPEQQQKQLDQLQADTDSFRQRLYKTAGIDPNQGAKYKTMGGQDNPFESKGMGIDEWNQTVPMGGWYKDQNGKVKQRTIAPGQTYTGGDGKEHQMPFLPGQQSQSNASDNYAGDMMANTPVAGAQPAEPSMYGEAA